MLQLSLQQEAAYDAIMAWYADKENKQFVLAGFAGTGKTTLAKVVAESIGQSNVVFCAFTGKAAKVLSDKGCVNAGTIHSTIYALMGEDQKGEPVFGFAPSDTLLLAKPLMIVDEYSMLSYDIIEDIRKTDCKVLYLGDPFQLPPIRKLEPEQELIVDFFLEDVHRHALDSTIIRIATDIRNGIMPEKQDTPDFVYKLRPTKDDLVNADQIIVGYNKTRRATNDYMRKHYGFDGIRFYRGEKVICGKNNKYRGLQNGLIGVVDKSQHCGSYSILDVLADGIEYRNLSVWNGDIEGMDGKSYDYKTRLERFDYGYAITCHKSQGSEFNDVVLVNEPIGKTTEEKRRWLYTGVTRCRTKLTLVDS